MPSPVLTAEFKAMRSEHASASAALVPLALRMALDSVAEVLPGASALDVFGRVNEDWIPVLRIQRVLDEQGDVLFETGRTVHVAGLAGTALAHDEGRGRRLGGAVTGR